MIAYRLAKLYGVHPSEFLTEPISTLLQHAELSAQIIEEERSRDE